MRLLSAAERLAKPWKNGGGITREIAAHPPGADLAAFDWRISTATVATAGPFSLFPGVDRILLVLDGKGLALGIADAKPQVLAPGAPPLAFPGDVPVEAELADGPITDLNIMVRRGAWTAQVERLTITAPTTLQPTAEVQFAVAVGDLQVGDASIGFADAVRFDQALTVALATIPADLILIRLSRTPPLIPANAGASGKGA